MPTHNALIITDTQQGTSEKPSFRNSANSNIPHTGNELQGVTKYTMSNPPNSINKIRNNRNKLIKDSRIVELTRKLQCERYAISRLTDSAVFDQVRSHLAIFHLFDFTSYEGLTKSASEIMIKNQGLPTQEALMQLYLFFCQERGVNKTEVIKDLESCAANCRARKEKQFDIERKRRSLLTNNK